MRKSLFILLFIINFSFCKSQQLQITYTFTTPLNAKVQEDLYIEGNRALDIRDSIFIYEKSKNNVSSENGGIAIRSKNKIYKEKYYKSALDKTILMKSNVADKTYWIEDNPPKIVWNTSYDETKVINNYKCKKATAVFRGSSIVAYYTTDLPYPYGPFKFGGLPGVILEVGEENSNVNTWIANIIQKNPKLNIDIKKPENIKDINTISYKDFEELILSSNRKDVKNITSNLSKGTIVSEFKTVRKGIEKKYEWEE